MSFFDRIFHGGDNLAESIAALAASVETLKGIIMTTKEELTAQLEAQATKIEALTTQTAKVGTEVQALKDAIANSGGTVDPAIVAAADRVGAAIGGLSTALQGVDEMNPDA